MKTLSRSARGIPISYVLLMYRYVFVCITRSYFHSWYSEIGPAFRNHLHQTRWPGKNTCSCDLPHSIHTGGYWSLTDTRGEDDPDRENGKGHVRTFAYGRISSTSEGDGKVTRLVSEVCIYDLSTLLCRLWVSTSLDTDMTEDCSLTPQCCR